VLLALVTNNFGRHIVNARILLTHLRAVNCDVIYLCPSVGLKALSADVA